VALTVRVDVSLSVEVLKSGQLALCLAAASPTAGEALRVQDPNGAGVAVREVRADGGRVHLVDVPTREVQVSYRAEADLAGWDAEPVSEIDALVYRRPSRYCPSDRLSGFAAAEFGSLDPQDAALAVERWLYEKLSYVPGSTDARDDALHPLLTRTGVCRDYAHLGVALCRALGIPARYAAVYAPGLSPMDFHAVFEAAIDGRWYVFDGTRLAPRRSLTRIASGRDAADTAFLTPLSAVVGSVQHDVTVTADPDLPVDDRNAPVPLA
jgi:transglutaminase-like putative cysteine protease